MTDIHVDGPGTFTVGFTPDGTAPPPPPPPVPTGAQPALPSGFVKVGTPKVLSVDPTGSTWDSAPGQTPIYGYMNNVKCIPQNVFKDASGLHVRLSAGTVGATCCTLPQHAPSNPKTWGGASTGFSFTNGVLELGIIWAVVNGKVPAWFAAWLLAVDNVWKGDGEDDIAEIARWQGGNGVLTVNEHDLAGDPDWVVKNLIVPGAVTRHTIVRQPGSQGSLLSTFCEGQPVEENYQTSDHDKEMYLVLSAGLGAGQPVPALPVDMILASATYWPLG